MIDYNKDYIAMNLGDYSIDYCDDDYVRPHELLTVELSRGCKLQVIPARRQARLHV